MRTQKQLEALLESILIESTIEYLEAKEVPVDSDTQALETHIQGVMVNEGVVPELELAVRCSKTFSCIQPGYRDYAELSDYQMSPDIEWEFFHASDRKADNAPWDEAKMIRALLAHTEMASFNPMLSFD